MAHLSTPEAALAIRRQRYRLLIQLQQWLERPMIVLAFVWLALFVWEMLWGLSPVVEVAGYVIWAMFIIEFLLGFTIAPDKVLYIARNPLRLVSLMLPALRVFSAFRLLRVARAAGAVRGVRLMRVLTVLNRGMRAFGHTMHRRGFGYVVGLTVIVTLVGAAGMYAFESNPGGRGLNTYGAALWWTAMVMTTMGSDYWPQTPEGRVLCFLLALYAFTVFGYLAAALASYFIGRDREPEVEMLKRLARLQADLAALQTELEAARQQARSGRS